MKKLLTIVLCFCFLFSFVACQNNGGETNSSPDYSNSQEKNDDSTIGGEDENENNGESGESGNNDNENDKDKENGGVWTPPVVMD